MALVYRLVAKCMNVELKRFENFWSPEHYSAVCLEDEAVIIDKIIVPSEPVGIYGGMTETKYCLSVQGYNKKGKVKVKGVKVTKLVFDSHEVGDTISLVRKMPCSGKSNQDKKH